MENPLEDKQQDSTQRGMDEKDGIVRRTYNDIIDNYRRASKSLKSKYNYHRYLTILLAALITLISSFITAEFFAAKSTVNTVIVIAIPVLAAILTVIIGLSDCFQRGAMWQEMIMNTQKLEKERDRFFATETEKRDYAKESEILQSIIHETAYFSLNALAGDFTTDAPPSDVKKKKRKAK